MSDQARLFYPNFLTHVSFSHQCCSIWVSFFRNISFQFVHKTKLQLHIFEIIFNPFQFIQKKILQIDLYTLNHVKINESLNSFCFKEIFISSWLDMQTFQVCCLQWSLTSKSQTKAKMVVPLFLKLNQAQQMKLISTICLKASPTKLHLTCR